MALFNRAKMSVSGTPGTGTITLGAAVPGFQSFTAAGATNGATVSYTIEDGLSWEYGRGTYSTSGPTLARTTVLGSSSGGPLISATSGAQVFITALAQDIAPIDNPSFTTQVSTPVLSVASDLFRAFSIAGNFYWCFNAVYLGVNGPDGQPQFNRIHTDQPSWMWLFNMQSSMLNQTYKAVTTWVAQPGANPIGNFTAIDGWNIVQSFSQFKDMTLGGYGFEIDGNGTYPYGRLQHATVGTARRTGILTNLSLDELGKDSAAYPSWWFGINEDASEDFRVQRQGNGTGLAGAWNNLFIINSGGQGTFTGGLLINGNQAVARVNSENFTGTPSINGVAISPIATKALNSTATTYLDGTGNWSSPSSGAGSVTNVATGTGLTGGPITSTGTIALANMAGNTLKGNNTSGSAAPADLTVSQVMTMLNAAALSGAQFSGKLHTVASSTGSAGLKLAHGTAPTAPVDGDVWTTTGGIYAQINGFTYEIALRNGSSPFTAKQTFSAGSASQASINLPHGAAPTTPANGDVWTTAAGGLFARVNGNTVNFPTGTIPTQTSQLTNNSNFVASNSTPTFSTGAVHLQGWNSDNNQGVLFLGNSGSTYLHYDGAAYNFPTAPITNMGNTVETQNHKDAANGYAGLDSSGKVPTSKLHVTVSSSAPSGGSDGDIWFVVP